MAAAQYSIAHVSEIVTTRREEPGKAPWHSVRRHFDIGSFAPVRRLNRMAWCPEIGTTRGR